MSSNGGINTRKGSESPLLIYFCIFAAVFLLSFLFVSFVAGIVNTLDVDERAKVLVTSAVQNLFVFIGTPVITSRLESQNPIMALSLNISPGWRNVFLVAVCYFIGMCFLNQLIFWNESIVFPESLHELEEKLRGWENSSRHFTDAILSTTTIGGLVSGIAIVGCLTGFAEELFFRAGIQRLLCKAIPGHAAVWISAFIFSAMHFQFFGFFPRLLLGAIFGYFYLWSGSIWTSVIAHALNNSMVVITAWLTAKGCVSADIENFGVTETGFPWFAMSSGILLILVLYLWQKNLSKNNGKSHF